MHAFSYNLPHIFHYSQSSCLILYILQGQRQLSKSISFHPLLFHFEWLQCPCWSFPHLPNSVIDTPIPPSQPPPMITCWYILPQQYETVIPQFPPQLPPPLHSSFSLIGFITLSCEPLPFSKCKTPESILTKFPSTSFLIAKSSSFSILSYVIFEHVVRTSYNENAFSFGFCVVLHIYFLVSLFLSGGLNVSSFCTKECFLSHFLAFLVS